MSATAAEHGTDTWDDQADELPVLKAYFWAFSIAALSGIGVAASRGQGSVSAVFPEVLVWVLAVAVADLLPMNLWGPVHLTMSLPVTLAAAMLFPPPQAALIAFVGSADPRELTGKVSIGKALYNRSQIAVTVYLAALLFQSFDVSVVEWPLMLGPAVAMLLLDSLVNATLVMVPTALRLRISPAEVVRRVFGDSPLFYLLGYLTLGLFAVLIATTVSVTGEWGVVIFLVPLGLTRIMFLQARRLNESAGVLERKTQALVEASARMAAERRDERLVVAGELHDEVLPPLFNVHLMGQVLRQDLLAGRLLDLDQDLPQLLAATEAAQEAIRGLLNDLRRSPLGAGGLTETIRATAQQLESTGSTRFRLDLVDVGGSYLSQFLVFQVAREAMNNAARHSRSGEIDVRLWRDAEMLRLMVRDRGVGFDIRTVDASKHFGLQLLAERVEAAQGRVVVDSRLGEGTTVTAALPPDLAGPEGRRPDNHT